MKLSFDAYMRSNGKMYKHTLRIIFIERYLNLHYCWIFPFNFPGRDPSPMWERIEDAISTVVLQKEKSIVRLLRNYPSKRNFFEMIRFDFAVDNDLNVFIMEVSSQRFGIKYLGTHVLYCPPNSQHDSKIRNFYKLQANMSPNLSSAHFPPNRLIYYQVLYNLFALIGLTEYGQK